MADDRVAHYAAVFAGMQASMGQLDAEGLPQYKDVHHWLQEEYGTADARDALVRDLQGLEGRCREVLGLAAGDYQTTVPSSFSDSSAGESRPATFKLRLWQVDFRRTGQVKAGASLHAIRDCVHKNLVGRGNETAKYPLEVLFDWQWSGGGAAGSEIVPFSIGVAIGTATTVASYLTAIYALRLNLLEDALRGSSGPGGPGGPVDLATRLLKCLVLHATSDPKPSLEEQILDSLRTKIQASARTRPTPLQMHNMLSKVVDQRAQARGRVPRATLFREVLSKHNSDSSAKTRVPIEEMSAIILLDEAGVGLQDVVALAWQAESPPYTALPVSLLNQSFLNPEAPLPVPPSCTLTIFSYLCRRLSLLLGPRPAALKIMC